jgi:hypothetical protein
MDYRGQDLDLRTARWSASSTDPTGWREASPAQPQSPPHPAPRPVPSRAGPIWVDDALLACANQAYDVAMAYRSYEVRLEHLLLAMTRFEPAAQSLEARGVRVVSLRRDCAVVIAGEPAAGTGETVKPSRSAELEDVLRLASSRASHQNRPAGVDDVVQALSEIGGDLPGGDLIARHFPRPTREYWGNAGAQRGQHLTSHRPETSEAESPLAIAPPQSAPVFDQAVLQTIFDRLADLERAFSERLFAVEQALARQPAPLPPTPIDVDFGPVETRLSSIETALQTRPAGEGVVAIDPALGDRLWAIEHALGVERTERTSAVTQLSDEITGVRSAVRLAAQNSEEAYSQLSDQLLQLSATIELRRNDVPSDLGGRIAGIEQALDSFDQKAAETQAVYSAEIAELHDALMKISANQHTLAGALDNWRNNDSGEIHLINTRIGAVHEDGAKRLAAIEKLCADVETLSQLVLEDRTLPKQQSSFKHWLYGTEDWIRASWRGPKWRARPPRLLPPRTPRAPRAGRKWPRLHLRLPFKRGSAAL